MTLFGRIALTGAGLLVVAGLLALLVWRPSAERAFVSHTRDLRRDAERDFAALAIEKVERAMDFATQVALFSEEQRVLAIEDLPFELFTDAEGRLERERLREAVRETVSDPARTGGQKHTVARQELLSRTRRDLDTRLERLRDASAAAAARHGALATRRTLAAFGGMLLLVLAGWAVVLDRVVVRPVRAVTGAVARFGAGERGVRLAPGGAAELARLGRAFNDTAAAVERAEAENAELREQLEQKVRERTAALVRAARASTAGTMAGGIAHEFNNLLGGILGCAEAALDEEPAPDVREAVEMIRKTASRGVGITSALLRATRAEPERATCDPRALFEEALAEVRPSERVAVRRDFTDDLAPLRADATMLRQVLANLIRNAVSAMGDEGGTLTLRVAREPGPVPGAPGAGEAEDGDVFGEAEQSGEPAAEAAGAGGAQGHVVLEVADTGPGIEESVKDILFEPFVTTRRGGREGAGLGLFLADRLVHAHRGRIDVETEQEKGTKFVIRLPE